MNSSNRRLVVTGGGTGGHVFAGISIADEWKKKYPNARILFVGASGGIEERLVPKAGYPLEVVHLGSLKGVSISKRVKTLVQVPLALLKAARLLIALRPKAVIGVGGYASGPVVLIARLIGWSWGVQTAILEQNAVPGFTNRVLARFAHQVFCAFPGIEEKFKREKTFITGNPVRNVMVPNSPAEREPFSIFIFGGSQGALGINSLVLDSFKYLRDILPHFYFIHQTGERDHERVLNGYRKAGINARIEKFIYEMPECYRAASLVICRAGSSTLSELAAVHRAAILVPFPHASDNHQEKNARLFVDRGAADLLIQGKSDGKTLAGKIRDYFLNPEKISRMENAVSRFHLGNAAEKIVARLDPDRGTYCG